MNENLQSVAEAIQTISQPSLADKILQPEIIAIIGGCAVPIIGAIAYFTFAYFKHKSNNQLKRDLLDRNMSVEDIERIIKAGQEE